MATDWTVVSLHYWDSNHVDSFKNSKKRYLAGLENAFGNVSTEGVLLSFDKNHGEYTGHVSFMDCENSYERIYTAVDYALSRGSSNLPVWISINKKNDFSLIEDILRDHYGESVKLNYGLFNIGKLMKEAKFKVRK